MGPYAQAIKVGDLLFCSGSLGLDPAVGKLVRAVSTLHDLPADRMIRLRVVWMLRLSRPSRT